MWNFQDTFETHKQLFISFFFNLHDCNFEGTYECKRKDYGTKECRINVCEFSLNFQT